MPQSLWIPFGCSVKGASHRRKEEEYKDVFFPQKENQDAFHLVQGAANADGDQMIPSVIAVSDGHGGNKYIRSNIGSKIAVTHVANYLWKNTKNPLSKKMRKDELADAIRHIKTRVLVLWQEGVDNHFKLTPFKEEEVAFLKEHCPQKDYDAVLSDDPLERGHRLAYGCTFLCAIAYDDLILILQLGDGDILGLYPKDDVRELIKSDSRNIGNETLSLCSLRDVSDITHEVLIGEEIPQLITLTTDGVKNSYDDQTSDIEAFYNIPVVIKNELLKNDLQADGVITPIEKWLDKVTTDGAGDDVTIGVLFRDISGVKEDDAKD
jgi:serine/threonine protein phosphatase PrpC